MKTKYAVSSKLPYSPDFEIVEAWSNNEAKREYQRRHPELKMREIQATDLVNRNEIRENCRGQRNGKIGIELEPKSNNNQPKETS